MSNDPRDLDGGRLANALRVLSRDPKLRSDLIDWLLKAENTLDYPGAVRAEITGPIIDALHTDDDRYTKYLADGTKFEFFYRTKIARDFLLAPGKPTHVWEPQTTRLLQHLTRISQHDVLIGGAYFGDHAIGLAKIAHPVGRLVHCFEPNTDQLQMLEVNARINNLDNVRPSGKGLYNQSSKRLELQGFDSFANAVESKDDASGFETVTIDDYCAAVKARLSVIMIDIEGGELAALQGAGKTLDQDRPNIVFEVHRDYVDWSNGLVNTPIGQYLTSKGYTLFAVRDFNTNQEMGDRAVELIPAATVYLEGPSHGFNMLAVTDVKTIADPLFRQVPGVSPKLLRHKAPELHHPVDGMPPA